LVLNKNDLLDAETFERRRDALIEALHWQGPVYGISALTGEGTAALMQDLLRCVEAARQGARSSVDQASGDEPWHPLA
jgi:GTP-binding protein